MIRTARIGDVKLIQEFNLRLLHFQEKLHALHYDPQWPFSEEGELYFRNSILDEHACTLIAEEDGIIGYLIGWILEEDACRPGRQAEIENMFVENTHRSKGVGGKLVKEFLKWCEENKVKRIKVTALSVNDRAVDFYRKCGFSNHSTTLELHCN